MTKYILNSGNAKKFPEKEKAFLEEILKDFDKKKLKFLICFFSQGREDWEKKFSSYQENLKELAGDDFELTFELAFPDDFEEQCKNSDVIFIPGGDDHLLQYWLKKFDLEKIWEGKVVATSSAGSSALTEHSWTCDWRKCMDGLGILPIKFIPHYKSETYGNDDTRGPIDWEKAYEDLADYGDKSLPIQALEEGDFVVLEK
jgi:hypothetical protein